MTVSKPKREYRMVDEVTAESMDGKTPLERELNALLTRSFIGRKDLPSDECLYMAEHLIFWWPKHTHVNYLAERLGAWFGADRNYLACIEAAREVIRILASVEAEE